MLRHRDRNPCPVRSLLAPNAGAAEPWESAPFASPASEMLQAASAIKRERATNVVVMLDQRIFVFDEQHRVTRTSRLVYRVDSPDGVENWAASSAQWQPWHQARPTIRARVITRDGREHELDQKLLTDAGTNDGSNLVYDDDHTLHGPLPAVAVGAVIEELITVRDEKPFLRPAWYIANTWAGPCRCCALASSSTRRTRCH